MALTPHRYQKSHSISVRISQFRCALTEALEFLSVENTDKRQFANLEFFDLLELSLPDKGVGGCEDR